MRRDKNLLDLPILLHDRDQACGSSEILDSFLSELDAAKTVEKLKAFLAKWQNMWLLSHPLDDSLNDLEPEEQKLLTGNFDHDIILSWLQRKEEDKLPYDEDENVRIMAHISMPTPTLWAFMLAKHYGVGVDLGFVRYFLDPYPELEHACRCGSGRVVK
jgi:hypothetical protein